MAYERLWAPWRLAYIKSAHEAPSDAGCFLCRYRDDDADEENLVVARGPRVFVVLNRFPYNNGHLLIAPLAHKGELSDVEDPEHLDAMRQLGRMVEICRRVLNADGFNIGLNLGRPAGAGLPGHLHWHLVPRWNGDTNFMTVVDDVRVISQSLKALYGLLRSEIDKSLE